MKIFVDIVNISPSVSSNGAIVGEILLRKVLYNYLKVFGCRAFVHISKDE